ncbi:hypothetical protein D3C73_1213810 [compost metagenome]
MRSRGRHAFLISGVVGRQCLRPASACGGNGHRSSHGAVAGRSGRAGPAPFQRTRRDHRGANAPGCGGNVHVPGRVCSDLARDRGPPRFAADPGRDRHGIRANRRALRGAARGGRPGHSVRRQGPDRRLPHPRCDAVHGRRCPHGFRRRGGGSPARANFHGQSPGVRRSKRKPGHPCGGRLERGRVTRRCRSHGRPGSGSEARRRCGRSHLRRRGGH